VKLDLDAFSKFYDFAASMEFEVDLIIPGTVFVIGNSEAFTYSTLCQVESGS
jgi:hypothetical protein